VGTDVYNTLDQAQGYISTIRAVAPNKPVMLPEIGYNGVDSASYWTKVLTELPSKYPYIKGFCLWEYPEGENLTVADSATLPAFKQGIASSYYSSNVYGSLGISPLDAIGRTLNPTPAQPLFSSTSTSTKSPSLNYQTSSSYIIIVGVIAAIAVATVSLVLRKKYMKNIKLEAEKLEARKN
jgi:hypothetical protein